MKPVTVTNENFEALLIASAGEAAAIARGDTLPPRATTHDRGYRGVAVPDPTGTKLVGAIEGTTPPVTYEASRLDDLAEAMSRALDGYLATHTEP